MRCYMIVFGAFTDYPRFMAGYQQVVGPLVERSGGRNVFMGQQAQVLEGAWSDAAVISEWPDRAAALRFWHSPEYSAVRPLRAGSGQFQVVLLDAPAPGAADTS